MSSLKISKFCSNSALVFGVFFKFEISGFRADFSFRQAFSRLALFTLLCGLAAALPEVQALRRFFSGLSIMNIYLSEAWLSKSKHQNFTVGKGLSNHNLLTRYPLSTIFLTLFYPVVPSVSIPWEYATLFQRTYVISFSKCYSSTIAYTYAIIHSFTKELGCTHYLNSLRMNSLILVLNHFTYVRSTRNHICTFVYWSLTLSLLPIT